MVTPIVGGPRACAFFSFCVCVHVSKQVHWRPEDVRSCPLGATYLLWGDRADRVSHWLKTLLYSTASWSILLLLPFVLLFYLLPSPCLPPFQSFFQFCPLLSCLLSLLSSLLTHLSLNLMPLSPLRFHPFPCFLLLHIISLLFLLMSSFFLSYDFSYFCSSSHFLLPPSCLFFFLTRLLSFSLFFPLSSSLFSFSFYLFPTLLFL